MILKQKTLQKLIQIMKLKENQKKKNQKKEKKNQCHIVVSNTPNKHSKVKKSKDETTQPQSRRYLWVW